MSTHECDVIVVGLGPGGETVVAKLATAGLNVVAVEAGWSGASALTGGAYRPR